VWAKIILQLKNCSNFRRLYKTLFHTGFFVKVAEYNLPEKYPESKNLDYEPIPKPILFLTIFDFPRLLSGLETYLVT